MPNPVCCRRPVIREESNNRLTDVKNLFCRASESEFENTYSPQKRNADEHHMRVHPGVLITKIGVGNMVVLVSQIKRGVAVGREQLHSATKLSREVEVRLPKHPMVEIQESSTTREERFDAPKVHEVYLRTDRTATDAVRVYPVTIPSARIAHQCRSCVENPADCEWFPPVNEPFIPILELIIPC